MLGGEPRPDELPGVVEKIAPTLELLDSLIDPSGFALGRFTIADVAAAPILFRTTKTRLDLERLPEPRPLARDAPRAPHVRRGRSGHLSDRRGPGRPGIPHLQA